MTTTVPISPTDTLGSIVTTMPSAARVLERLGLDYCCHGQRTLADACAEAALDVDEVIDQIGSGSDREPADWATMTAAELADHIEVTHHRLLHDELPRLTALADKVRDVHGSRHPELDQVNTLTHALEADLEPHMMKEERVLFPMIRELAHASATPTFHCGSIRNPISMMMLEHERTGELLEQLRAVTDGYEPPADGCASYRALYQGLADVERDTHLHIHKENNVLFPLVLELEASLSGAAD